MKRIISDKLLEWKHNKNRKPLLLTGVRQCGKTYVLKKFAKTHYEDFAYLNFEKNPDIASVFDIDFDPNRIIKDLSNFFLNKKIIPGKTLLILDEIQISPKAITALKYFNENLKDLDVVCAGSLLGVTLKRELNSFPVGQVDLLKLYPMNFKEFLWAINGNDYEINFSNNLKEIPDYIHNKLIKDLFLFYLVGGMPEAVKIWKDTKNINEVYRVLDNIILGYRGDFSKYYQQKDLVNLINVWDSIPVQLAEDNHKFIFNRVKKSARAKDLESAVLWLHDAGLINLLKKVENVKSPLSFYADDSYYKLYLSDIGILSRISRISYESIFIHGEISGNFRGALTENFILNELISQNFSPHYWKSKNIAEVDFLIEYKDLIIPLEAKAMFNTKAKSLISYIKKYEPKISCRFSMRNLGINKIDNSQIISLPLYLVKDLKNILKDF